MNILWIGWCYFSSFYHGTLGCHKTNGVKKFPETRQINYYVIDNNLSIKSDQSLTNYCCKVSQ